MTTDKKKEIIKRNLSMIDSTLSQNNPLVSIIMLNRNGVNHLKRFFNAFKENTIYPNYEIVIVDNASTDGSIQLLENESRCLPLRIIKNEENQTFSQANNKAIKYANGEYVLLMNNDIQPTYGWLNEMIKCAFRHHKVGAIGAKLVYPDCSDSLLNKDKSYKIQHTGIAFSKEKDFICPYNMGNGQDVFNSDSDVERPRAAVTAAVLLIRKDIYFEVEGLDERYNYGYEDVDLGLKLLQNGYQNIYCPTSLLFHYEFGTQSKDDNEVIRKRRIKNKEVFYKKWNKWLENQIFIDKINNTKFFTEDSLKISFAVTEYGPNTSAGDYFTALELGKAMEHLGWKISFLPRKGPENWYEVDISTDILISMLESYDLSKIECKNRNLIKIGWARNWFDRWANYEILDDYDLVFASSETACSFIEKITNKECMLLPIATNHYRFNPDNAKIDKYNCDYCFTGSYWNDPREIIDFLNPEKVAYKFNLYGKNWYNIIKFKPYYKGFVQYNEMPNIYSSTKIVIDDANRVTRPYGSVNSRVFDAIANGSLVLTNGDLGAKETFKGLLPVFRSEEELTELLNYYLSNEKARVEKVKELREYLLHNHTYTHRAQTIKNILLDKYCAKI